MYRACDCGSYGFCHSCAPRDARRSAQRSSTGLIAWITTEGDRREIERSGLHRTRISPGRIAREKSPSVDRTDRFATAMLDASGLQRSAARRRRLQTHSSELFDFFGDLIARPRLLICGLGFDSPPAHQTFHSSQMTWRRAAAIIRGGSDAPGVRKNLRGRFALTHTSEQFRSSRLVPSLDTAAFIATNEMRLSRDASPISTRVLRRKALVRWTRLRSSCTSDQ